MYQKVLFLLILFFIQFSFIKTSSFNKDNSAIVQKKQTLDTLDYIVISLSDGDTLKAFEQVDKDRLQHLIVIPKTNDSLKLTILANHLKLSLRLIVDCQEFNKIDFLLGQLAKICDTNLYDLSLVNIRNLYPSEILKFKELNGFVLSDTNIYYIPKFIYEKNNLKFLGFGWNKKLTFEDGISKLNELTDIVFGSIYFNNFPNDFKDLEKIKEISFNYCEFRNIEKIIEQISKINHKIDRVVFAGCKMDFKPEIFSKLINVKTLQIGFDQNIDSALIELKKMLPNTEIIQ